MMQKVRVLVSAFLCFTGLFHFSFSVPLRYFVYSSVVPFPSPVLRWKNDLINQLGCVSGGIYGDFLVLFGWASCLAQGDPICTDDFSV